MENQKKPVNKLKLTVIIVVVVCLMLLSFGGGYLTYYFTLSKNQREVLWAIGMIDRNFLVYDEETGEIKDYTTEDYMNQINNLLDLYSTYYTKEEYNDAISTSLGNQYGVGVSFSIDSDNLEVILVAGNSPAEKAGIKVGSVILGVQTTGGEYVALSNFEELAKEFSKIEKETEFSLKISYNNEEKFVTVSKQIYNQSYVSYYDNQKSYKFISEYGKKPEGQEFDEGNTLLLDDTGYIKFTGFEGNSAEQFGEAYNYMISRGKTKLVLDMRNNGGGLMNILQEIAPYLIYNEGKSKNLVALAKYKNGKTEKFYTSSNKYQDIKISVIANDGSASATECLIGAMLTYNTLSYDNLVITKKAGETIGSTYGKGIMQTTFPNIFMGNAIKLTTAYIYWPDGVTNIHKKGIKATEENSILQNADLTLDDELQRAVQTLI